MSNGNMRLSDLSCDLLLDIKNVFKLHMKIFQWVPPYVRRLFTYDICGPPTNGFQSDKI